MSNLKSPIKIINWLAGTPSQQLKWKEEIKEIFFLSSSRKEFYSPKEKEAFWHRWTDFYFESTDQVWMALVDNDCVCGYLMGCLDSFSANSHIQKEIPSFSVFEDQFSQYPAHLHINLYPSTRGKGIGTLLTEHFIAICQSARLKGVHIVTSPSQRNVSFYEKNQFSDRIVRQYKGFELLFMGRRLNS